MVLPALLRDPPCDPVETRRRYRDVLVNRNLPLLALARHLARALGSLPAGFQDFFLGVRRDRHRARLPRLAAAGRWIRDRGPHPHCLLLPASPGHHSVARAVRATAPASRLYRRFRAWLGPARRGASGGGMRQAPEGSA